LIRLSGSSSIPRCFFSITVFFIAKPGKVSSIPTMTSRLILAIVATALALSLNSCCCMF
jgi:hypothetical protein